MNIKKQKVIRESNIELMRIISMFMIVMWHLLGYSDGSLAHATPSLKILLTLIQFLLIVHVNSFILATGYFQCDTKFKLKKAIYLILLVWFYKVVSFLVMWHFFHLELSTLDILKNISPINYQDYWFLSIYILLYFISPILNKIILTVNKREFLSSIIILFFIVSILASFTGDIAFDNHSGYSLANFILLYFIGAFLKHHPLDKKNKILSKNLKQLIYISSFILIAIFNLFSYYFSNSIKGLNPITDYISYLILKSIYSYGNPFIILQSIIYFKFFTTLSIKSKVINFIAGTTLGVYLIHTNKLLRSYLYQYFGYTHHMTNSINTLVFLLLGSALLFILCSILDVIRQLIFRFISNRKLFKKLEEKVLLYIRSLGIQCNW